MRTAEDVFRFLKLPEISLEKFSKLDSEAALMLLASQNLQLRAAVQLLTFNALRRQIVCPRTQRKYIHSEFQTLRAGPEFRKYPKTNEVKRGRKGK